MKLTQIQKLQKRIDALERELAALKAQPQSVIHYHYDSVTPRIAPLYPSQPWQPYWVTTTGLSQAQGGQHATLTVS